MNAEDFLLKLTADIGHAPSPAGGALALLEKRLADSPPEVAHVGSVGARWHGDIEITIGGKTIPLRSISYNDHVAPTVRVVRTPGAYRASDGLRLSPRYPGEGNREERRAAAKGKPRSRGA